MEGRDGREPGSGNKPAQMAVPLKENYLGSRSEGRWNRRVPGGSGRSTFRGRTKAPKGTWR